MPVPCQVCPLCRTALPESRNRYACAGSTSNTSPDTRKAKAQLIALFGIPAAMGIAILRHLASQAALVLRNAALTAELRATIEDLRASRRRLVEA